jgi:hypothetical protein
VTDTAHPLLPAATPLLRDGAAALQVGGVDSGAGVLLGPDGAGLTTLLRGLDGGRSQRAVLGDADRDGLDRATVVRVLDGLRAAGLLMDVDAADLLAADAGPAAAARTATELPAALSAAGGAAWRTRRAAVVVVEGGNRVGVPLAASPLTDLRPLPHDGGADLVVLARPWAASDPLAAGIHHARVPHLVATVRGETGIVGPLVVPGVTSCLRCADLHRRDADPRWPWLAAQLTAAEPPPSGATVTCLLTAATAALQVLAYLDGAAAPVTLDATVELRPPALQPRVRRWPPHPGCGCGAGRRSPTSGTASTLPDEATEAPPGGRRPRQGTMGG